MSSAATTWWSVDIQRTDNSSPIEDQLSPLFALGVKGAQILSDDAAQLYCEGEGATPHEILNKITAHDFIVTGHALITPEQFAPHPPELYTPLTIASITIRPLEDIPADIAKFPRTESDIIIIPGTGFGTGHHHTTHMLTELLHHEKVQELSPVTTLDLGTGSGLLALVAAKLYGGVVHGVDNDPLAIENAATNLQCNPHLATTVTLQVGTIAQYSQTYDLLIANLYAELLVQLAPDIVRRLKRSSLLLLSGIQAEKEASVVEAFIACGWHVTEQMHREGWSALLLQQTSQTH